MTQTQFGSVLVVEDDLDIRELLCELLKFRGYNVSAAENGSVALDHLHATASLPELILLDISMPVMDGYAFRTEQVRYPRLATIPTVMVSADGHVKDKAQRAGLTEYLKKPVEFDVLMALVEKYCGA